jgi:glycine betaine/proline transport system ATP-binding protein
MVFQHFGLLPHYKVLDNVAYPLKVRGTPKEERYKVAEDAIKNVGLKGWEDYLPGSLSGGMQQRVGIARALAIDPQLLLMDEPFSGLDPLIRREMQDELCELQEKVQKTIIFVTHDLHEALKLGDRIAIMRDGEIIQVGSPEEVITSPADDYVREFVQDALPAKVLKAGTIMEEPALLLYEWQSPKVARTLLGHSKQDHAFVLTKHRKLVGVVNQERLRDLERKGTSSLKGDLINHLPTCTPDMLLEEIFPLATSSHFSIPVLDENGKFLGNIHNRTIIESMIQDSGEEEP